MDGRVIIFKNDSDDMILDQDLKFEMTGYELIDHDESQQAGITFKVEPKT
jgi:hypothetical protein